MRHAEYGTHDRKGGVVSLGQGSAAVNVYGDGYGDGTIRWNLAGPKERYAVANLCGWNSRTAQRLARCTWEKLSSAARRVMVNHGIKGE